MTNSIDNIAINTALKSDSFENVKTELTAIANTAKRANRKIKTVILPVNKSAYEKIRLFLKTFDYKFTEHKTAIARDTFGNRIRHPKKSGFLRVETEPYFKLYTLGNLNHRTVQSISARINRTHRRLNAS